MSRIGYLINKKYQLERNKSNYNRLKESLESTLNDLSNCVNDVSGTDEILKSNYQINGDTNEGAKRVKKLQTKIEEKKNDIDSRYIPAINEKIEEINRKIEEVEREIEEEYEKEESSTTYYYF